MFNLFNRKQTVTVDEIADEGYPDTFTATAFQAPFNLRMSVRFEF